MNRFQTAVSTVALFVAGLSFVGCTPGGVGDPCIPEDEYGKNFAGYGVDEVNVEAMSFQCQTRLCLVNHFQGRVSCPYGQKATLDAAGNVDPTFPGVDHCKLPDASKTDVTVEVAPQLLDRRAKDAVYCSCRCDGPDKNARYCDCPSGYGCTLLNEIPLGADQLLGSYCVRKGTAYNKTQIDFNATCSAAAKSTYCGYENYTENLNPSF
jgi:hypothetical protein